MLAVLQAIGETSIGERRAGIQDLIHKIAVGATVELVRAGLHGVVEIAATCLSVFGREVTGLNCDFLNRVGADLIVLILLTPNTVRRVLTLDPNGLRTGRHA